jgi:hypothetical protein
MEQAIRNVITAAVHKVKSKTYDVEPADPVQAFLDDLFAELFPASSCVSVEIPTIAAAPAPAPAESAPAPAPAPAKERKKPGPKPKVDEHGNPIKKEPKKKEDKPKPESVHVDKLAAPEVKKLKAISADFDKKAFLAYVNSLDRETFDSKSLEDHLRTLAAGPAPEPEPVLHEHECIEVLFNDTLYYVDPITKRVYEPEDNANVAVGYVGQAAFKDMPMPDTEAS